MTIYKKVKNIIEDTHKFTYVEREEKQAFKSDLPASLQSNPHFVQLAYKELVTLDCLHHSIMFSVASSCIESGSCPIVGYQRAIKLEHNTHSTIGAPTVLSHHQASNKIEVVKLRENQVILFEGRYFEVVKAANNNIGLTEITQ